MRIWTIYMSFPNQIGRGSARSIGEQVACIGRNRTPRGQNPRVEPSRRMPSWHGHGTFLRTVPPSQVARCAQLDEGMMAAMETLLEGLPGIPEQKRWAREIATLPMRLEGWG